MPIDVSVAGEPGWWLQRLMNTLTNPDRAARLQRLMDYHRGNPPLPEGAPAAVEAFQSFQRKARSNFAELVVSAVSERMTPVGFRTAVDSDVTGDAEVGDLWQRVGLDVICADTHDLMLALSEVYVIVGNLDDTTGVPVVTCEDPRFMVGEVDPANPRRLLASAKWLFDDVAGQCRAYLYLPDGSVHVAVGPTSLASRSRMVTRRYQRPDAAVPRVEFSARGWSWDETRSGTMGHGRMPVVVFRNKYGLGEFEQHTDLLDRINHEILNRMSISIMQAFRQRAVKNLPLVYPAGHLRAGQEIDYNQIFVAGPAAVWQLPEAAEMWESTPVDLRPILDAVHADLEHLAAATRTPMHMLTPAGENQSAEGASLSREGLTFKVDDRIARTGHPWAQVVSLILLQMNMTDRADLAKLRTVWAPSLRLSLAERADAASKVKDILPRRTLLIDVMGMSPADADRAMTELADEQLLAAQMQAAALAAAGVGAGGAARGAAASSAGAGPAGNPPADPAAAVPAGTP